MKIRWKANELEEVRLVALVAGEDVSKFIRAVVLARCRGK
jgi:hypothetical protein